MLTAPVFAGSAGSPWTTWWDKAEFAEHKADWPAAETCYKRAIDCLGTAHADSSLKTATTIKLAMVFVHQNKFASAEPLCNALLQYDFSKDKGDPKIARESIVWMDDLADTYASRPADAPNRKDCLKRALAIKQHIYGTRHVRLLKILNDCYGYYHTHLDEAAAVPILEQSIAIMEESHAFEYRHELTMALFELGVADLTLQRWVPLERSIIKVYPLIGSVYGPTSPVAATVATQMGFALFKQNRNPEALKWAQKAVGLRHAGKDRMELSST